MSWLSDLIKEFPAIAVAKERIALREDQLHQSEKENEKLKQEKKHLKEENARLLKRIKSEEFIEESGVFWKRKADGKISPVPYCPVCKLAMSVFPPDSDEVLSCSKCDFIAPFSPSKTQKVFESIEQCSEKAL